MSDVLVAAAARAKGSAYSLPLMSQQNLFEPCSDTHRNARGIASDSIENMEREGGPGSEYEKYMAGIWMASPVPHEGFEPSV